MGVEEKLRPTGAHPLYSLDRDAWVPVRDLLVSERLQTADGAVRIAALERIGGEHRVYNIEVEAEHEYLVSKYGIRAHNTCFPDAMTLAKSFNASKDAWHRVVKPGIVKDAQSFLKKIGTTNPDVGVGKAGEILLKNPKNGKTIVTDLLAEWYKL